MFTRPSQLYQTGYGSSGRLFGFCPKVCRKINPKFGEFVGGALEVPRRPISYASSQESKAPLAIKLANAEKGCP